MSAMNDGGVNWYRVAAAAGLAYLFAALGWVGVGVLLWGWDLIGAPRWFVLVLVLGLFTGMFVGAFALAAQTADFTREAEQIKQADELAARADEQHSLLLQGDERGLYGAYPPVAADV
jgi:uncharacterized membrane protein